MGDLFWNKVAGVAIGAVLAVLGIKELGHLLVPSHGAHELTAENTSYPVDWAALETGGGEAAEPVEEGPTDYGLLLANADMSNGERVARRCAACHTFDQGGANGVGPNLWDIVNRAIASHEGFNYSAALRELGGDWTYERLDHFIENPNSFAPGTAMAFRGLGDETQRMDLIVYLRSLSGNPAPLPAPLPEEDPAAEDAQATEEDLAETMGEGTAGEGEQAAEAVQEPEQPATDVSAGGEDEPQDGGR
jgi:cytochrome c